MTSPADWYLAAEARWAHLPQGEERERRTKRTFEEIRAESELVALRLPDLDGAEQSALLEEAVLDVHRHYGLPSSDHEEDLFQLRVDLVFERLQLLAREQKASPAVRAKLIARRLTRSWPDLPWVSAETRTRTAREVASILTTEVDPETRESAERYALRRADGYRGETT